MVAITHTAGNFDPAGWTNETRCSMGNESRTATGKSCVVWYWIDGRWEASHEFYLRCDDQHPTFQSHYEVVAVERIKAPQFIPPVPWRDPEPVLPVLIAAPDKPTGRQRGWRGRNFCKGR